MSLLDKRKSLYRLRLHLALMFFYSFHRHAFVVNFFWQSLCHFRCDLAKSPAKA